MNIEQEENQCAGKSLLLSTMKAYWEGKKELFDGLRIAELEKENPDAWQPYPVLYFDFNRGNYNGNEVLEGVLVDHLIDWEKNIIFYQLKSRHRLFVSKT